MTDEDFLQKLREAFAIEAEEHLQAMTSGLIELEKTRTGSRRKEIVETIFREAHSMKGAARAVNRSDIESVCQALESVFTVWKRDAPPTSAEAFDALNAALDFLGTLRTQPDVATDAGAREAVHAMVKKVGHLTGRPQPQTRAASPAPAAPAPPAPPAEAPIPAEHTHGSERLAIAETVRVPMMKMDALLRRAEEMVGVKLTAAEHASELRELGTAVEIWRKEWAKVRAAAPGATALREGVSGERVRDFLEWSDDHMRGMEKRLATFGKAAQRDERLVGAMVDDLLGDAKKLVMLPFAGLLDLFPKLARDLGRELGKEVELVLHGREVEIDKRILEEMKDALIHLVRNAIDHGIEGPDGRAARGKPPQGRITISVAQLDGNKVEIVIADDGDGIDAVRLKAVALKSRLVTEAEAERLTEQGVLSLIFQSGISTSPIVTEISGRGLGMAIVREKVEKLGGQIAIESSPHAGTSFRMLLPVTLATFKGILVEAGGQTFVIPTSSVERIARVLREEIQTVENRETILLEGHALSFAWLADVLELPRRETKEPRPHVETLVLGAAEQRIAFAVEAVHHEQEVLVKPLARPLLRVRNIAGATVLGSGTPVLILNVADLLKSAMRAAATLGGRSALPGTAVRAPRVHHVLVADDSVTSRMLLKNILESAGYHVTTAIDGMEALATVRAGDFDVVVSDVEMPRMDGIELTEKIRAEKKLADLPVVLVTALGTREHRERGIDAGANAYIVKASFDQSNLLEVLGRLV